MTDLIQTIAVGFFIVCVLISPVACTMHADYLISQEIRNGVPPTMAMCAHSVQHPCPQLDVRQ